MRYPKFLAMSLPEAIIWWAAMAFSIYSLVQACTAETIPAAIGWGVAALWSQPTRGLRIVAIADETMERLGR